MSVAMSEIRSILDAERDADQLVDLLRTRHPAPDALWRRAQLLQKSAGIDSPAARAFFRRLQKLIERES